MLGGTVGKADLRVEYKTCIDSGVLMINRDGLGQIYWKGTSLDYISRPRQYYTESSSGETPPPTTLDHYQR